MRNHPEGQFLRISNGGAHSCSGKFLQLEAANFAAYHGVEDNQSFAARSICPRLSRMLMLLPTAIPSAVSAASIGIPDTMLLMLLALMVFGPRRLPEIGRQIGKLMYEFRKISNDFKFQMEEELRLSEEAERQRKLSAATAEATHTPPPAPDFAQGIQPAVSTEAGASHAGALPPAEADAGLVAEPEPVASTFPSIQPPAQGSVVPRAFRGLVPPSVVEETPVASTNSSMEPIVATADFTTPLSPEPLENHE